MVKLSKVVSETGKTGTKNASERVRQGGDQTSKFEYNSVRLSWMLPNLPRSTPAFAPRGLSERPIASH